MTKLADHQSSDATKLLLIGDSGCLTGDTVVSVTRGNSRSKKKTMAQLYRLANSHVCRGAKKGQRHDTFLLADLGGHVGLHRMNKIVQSGEKEVFQICADGKTIRASADHEFKTATGWKALKDLREGDLLCNWRETRTKEIKVRGLGRRPETGRVTIYSIPYHPNAMQNVVAGRDYKRAHRARLLVEAAMNGLSLPEFISILRNSPAQASELAFLSKDVDVHHKDENPANDIFSNLEVLERSTHIEEHQDEKVRASKATTTVAIEEIIPCGVEMTYDIVMDDPHRNFIANGFVVHNSGKTSALISLVKEGYKLFIEDYDNGLDYFRNHIAKNYPDKMGNVHYKTLTDEYSFTGAGVIVKKADAFTKGSNAIGRWLDDDGTNLGGIGSWGPDTFLVIDSLSLMSRAAMHQVLALNNRLATGPEQRDWMLAQNNVENMLAALFSDSVRCNVIVTAHVVQIEDANGVNQGYPQTLGKSLSPRIPRYFNTMLLVKTSGAGANKKRMIRTVPDGTVGVKHSVATDLPVELPIETGLATFVKAARGNKPQSPAPSTAEAAIPEPA